MKLNEWNNAIEYANTVCETLKTKGYNVKPSAYTMYDGRKGINLSMLDNQLTVFEQYSSGIHSNILDFKNSIDRLATRIVNEC